MKRYIFLLVLVVAGCNGGDGWYKLNPGKKLPLPGPPVHHHR